MNAAILGSGKMARDIGAYLMKQGCNVAWVSHNGDRLASLSKAISRITRRFTGAGTASFYCYGDLAPLRADLLIEATTEDISAKREAFAAARSLCMPQTLQWTVSSSIMAGDIALGALNVHFFYPVEFTRIVEVVNTPTAAAYSRSIALLKTWGINVIEQTAVNAFAVNRLLLPCQNEALRLVMSGRNPQAIDEASAAGLFPAGMLSMMDSVGIDVIEAGARNYCARMALDQRTEYAPLLNGLAALAALGKQGTKNGNGIMRGSPLPWTASAAGAEKAASASQQRFAALFVNTCLRWIENGHILGPDCNRAVQRVFGIDVSVVDTARNFGRSALEAELDAGYKESGCGYYMPSSLIGPCCERPLAVISSILQAIANAVTIPYEDALHEETHLFYQLARAEDAP